MSKKKTQQILPWTNDELQALLKGVIAHGTEMTQIAQKV